MKIKGQRSIYFINKANVNYVEFENSSDIAWVTFEKGHELCLTKEEALKLLKKKNVNRKNNKAKRLDDLSINEG